jgi:hypothetical protein
MNNIIDRREALKKTALLMGAALSASSIAAIMNGCKSAPELNYKPQFFNEDQARLVAEVAEIFIPKTDTPGAKDVGVPSFIDIVLKDCYKQEERDRFLAGLTEFDEDAKKTYGDSFIYCDPEKQIELVKKYNEAAISGKVNPRPFILMAKELTLLGFFTSQPGAEQVLQYEAVPGAYKGCLPLSEAGNGKTWATG